MGRKKQNPTAPRKPTMCDRVGELVNLEKCPCCDAHPDCFAWINGRCTALKKSEGQGCIFYKPAEVALAECREAYMKMRKEQRVDLICKYMKPLTALGVFDEKIEAAGHEAESLEEFRESNYRQLLEKALEEAGREEELHGDNAESDSPWE